MKNPLSKAAYALPLEGDFLIGNGIDVPLL